MNAEYVPDFNIPEIYLFSAAQFLTVFFVLFYYHKNLGWGYGEACTGFWCGNLKEGDHWGDPGIDGRIILRWIFRKWDVGGMDWIELAHDRDRWLALVNAVMNLRVP
jgi:hypothetical protein